MESKLFKIKAKIILSIKGKVDIQEDRWFKLLREAGIDLSNGQAISKDLVPAGHCG